MIKKIITYACLFTLSISLIFILYKIITPVNVKPTIRVYEIQVEVHYPSRIDTLVFKDTFANYPEVNSYEGSNSISAFRENENPINRWKSLIETSAPLRIISVK